MKVYLATIGNRWEGDQPLGIFLDPADAWSRIDREPRDRDCEAVEVYELDGERLFDDPEDRTKFLPSWGAQDL